MKKLNEIKSLSDVNYSNYLNYKEIISTKKVAVIGKKEVLYLLPLVAGFASLGLLSVSVWFLMLSMPIICTGLFFMAVAFHSIYVNFCKRADSKVKLIKLRKLKASKDFLQIACLMEEYELTDRFQIEKLMFEINSLKTEIKHMLSSNLKYDKKFISLKQQELQEKEHLLNQINKNLPANSYGKKLDLLTEQTNLTTLHSNLD